MYIQLLSFKIWCPSQWFRSISVLKLNLLAGKLKCDFVKFIFVTLCQTMSSTAHAYCVILSKKFPQLKMSQCLAILAYTTGTTFKHQRTMWPELYRKLIVFLHIMMWHISVNSIARGYVIRVWLGSCDIHKTSQKRISMLNFETSLYQNVTANKRIGNMYFMYVVMACFKRLLRLEHDMLYSTVWPMHKICPMHVCWRPNPICMKRVLKSLSSMDSPYL